MMFLSLIVVSSYMTFVLNSGIIISLLIIISRKKKY
uniref:Uncharacterized protein n=1 Tax=Lepeophtheirus salmonis TaxID=72036 RepID=A0A0K2U0M1_LEPSM